MPVARTCSALLPGVVVPAISGAVALGTVLVACPALHLTTAPPRPVAADTVAQEGQMVALPNVAKTAHLPYICTANVPFGHNVGLGGLNVGCRTVEGQVRLRLLTQRRIAACIDPRFLSPPNKVPRSTLGAPSSTDDGPCIDGEETFGPRSAVTQSRSVFVHTTSSTTAWVLIAPPSATDKPEVAPVARVPRPIPKPFHAVGKAVHGRIMASVRNASWLRIDGASRDVLPTEHPANAGLLVVASRHAPSPSLEEPSAALGKPAETKLRSKQTANEAQRPLLKPDGQSAALRLQLGPTGPASPSSPRTVVVPPCQLQVSSVGQPTKKGIRKPSLIHPFHTVPCMATPERTSIMALSARRAPQDLPGRVGTCTAARFG